MGLRVSWLRWGLGGVGRGVGVVERGAMLVVWWWCMFFCGVMGWVGVEGVGFVLRFVVAGLGR